ncbi:Checkpoint RAD17-RFC complex, RAD17/RAD24 component [Phaffia rhodozyma]|uniref:Checkpoint RAD17-RFC complex, RAD17/RAD24 component n=1 Tax=Phaffia rhodozyma TaxID=264483 RepID=A0A0F7SQS8_PHARH|nr:Checkpoint RAD17-RFC complex, RAD17/RAD24 component [Phaffia rhodozyma]
MPPKPETSRKQPSRSKKTVDNQSILKPSPGTVEATFSASSKPRTMKRLGSLTSFSLTTPLITHSSPSTCASSLTSSQSAVASKIGKSKSKTVSFTQNMPSTSSDIGPSKTFSVKRKADVIELDQIDKEEEAVETRPNPDRMLKRKGTTPIEPYQLSGYKSDSHAASLWVDAYAPTSADDLAVHKKKISEVRSWLREALGDVDHPETSSQAALRGKYRRILALSGSAGVGKTATLKTVAQEMGIEIIDWVEGSEEFGIGGITDRESLTERFRAFLARYAYPSLSFDSDLSASPSTSSSSNCTSNKKILLLDDLPNLSHAPTRESFQQALRDFAVNWVPSAAPLVVIVSEAGDSGRAGESWMDRKKGENGWDVRSLLGKDVLDGPATKTISFNSIAPTLLLKSLNRVISLALSKSAIKPPQEAVELIVHSSNGDIRSAINALQFLCKVDMGRSNLTSEVKKTRKGRGGKSPKGADKELKELLNSVTRREQSLALFHALGKVLYNKRVGDPEEEKEDRDDVPRFHSDVIPLPSFLQQKSRRISKVDHEMLFAQSPVDISLFNLYLHQNYPLFTMDVDECFEAVDSISASDALRSDDDLWQSSTTSISYAFNLATRGILFGLPSPVLRRGQKVYKPDWFENARIQRETDTSLTDVGNWLAKYTSLGQISREVMTSQLIPQLKSLPIPPDYPAALPKLASLPFVPISHTRSTTNLRSILSATSDPVADLPLSLDGDADIAKDLRLVKNEWTNAGKEGISGLEMMTKRFIPVGFDEDDEDQAARNRNEEDSGGEIEGDEIEEF